MGRTLTLGIGGWTGTGKTTVANLFRDQLGAHVISLDAIGHSLYKDPEFCVRLRGAFGTCNREEISELVQRNSLWDKIDNLFQPYLRTLAEEDLAKSGAGITVIEGSLLLKLGLHAHCDFAVWVTLHPLELAAQRTAARACKPYGYGLNILHRQISSRLFDAGLVDLLVVQTPERSSNEVYNEIRSHLRV